MFETERRTTVCRLIADEVDAAAFLTTHTSAAWLPLKHLSPNVGYKKRTMISSMAYTCSTVLHNAAPQRCFSCWHGHCVKDS